MATAPDTSKYSKLTERQLTWPHIVAQWLCVSLIRIYVTLFFRYRVKGLEHQPPGWQSYVVACNHTSSLDPPLVSTALRFQPVSYLAKKELFESFWMRLYNTAMSSIAVNREKLELSSVKSALKVLKTGKWALGVFPEGTRRKDGDGTLGETKRGVAYFAHSAKVPILPLAIVHFTPPKGKKRIDVRIGPLIPYEPDMEAMGIKVLQAIADLIEQIKAEQIQSET